MATPVQIILAMRNKFPNQHLFALDKTKGKNVQGATFYQLDMSYISMSQEGKRAKIAAIYAGTVKNPLNIPIIFTPNVFVPQTKTVEQARAEAKKVGVVINVDEAGDLGEALSYIDQDYLAVVGPAGIPSRFTPSPIIAREYGKKSANAGKPLPHPSASIPLWLTIHSAKSMRHAGQPRSVIYDWTTRTTNSLGQDVFEQRTDSVGKTLNHDNFDQLVLAGDIIRRIVISFDAVVDSNLGLNLSWGINEIYTERPTSGTIMEMVDEDDCGIPDANSVAGSLSRMTIAPAATVSATPTTVATTAPATDQAPPEDEYDEGYDEGTGVEYDGEPEPVSGPVPVPAPVPGPGPVPVPSRAPEPAKVKQSAASAAAAPARRGK